MGDEHRVPDHNRRKRKPIKKCPNPLFESWLIEWKNQSAERNSNMQYVFGKALESLRKYPLPLKSGRDCKILEYFGDRICLLLDRRLAEYKAQNGGEVVPCEVPVEKKTARKSRNLQNKTPKKKLRKDEESGSSTVKSPKSPGNRKAYVPGWRTGAYALLVTLFDKEQEVGYKGYMLKSELLVEAQPLSDSSFEHPDAGSYYTAWSSMTTLIKKGLVEKQGCPAKFKLTEEGTVLSRKLKTMDDDDTSAGTVSVADFFNKDHSTKLNATSSTEYNNRVKDTVHKDISSKQGDIPRDEIRDVFTAELTSESEAGDSQKEEIIFLPGTFRVKLLVDCAETSGHMGAHNTDDATLRELTACGIPFETRRLTIGDFMWVCEHTGSVTRAELALPYLVERKRGDDLAKSIKDGRFHEQKFRMKQCGLQNLIYLMEGTGTQHASLPVSTLNQAVVNTQIVDGFIVKVVRNNKESVGYLSIMTRLLQNIYEKKTLVACNSRDHISYRSHGDCISLLTFKDLYSSSFKNKNFSVQEMFARHLLQLYGMSVEKVQAVIKKYPTPATLISSYQKCGSEKDKENLLAELTYGQSSRLVGPTGTKVKNMWRNVKMGFHYEEQHLQCNDTQCTCIHIGDVFSIKV